MYIHISPVCIGYRLYKGTGSAHHMSNWKMNNRGYVIYCYNAPKGGKKGGEGTRKHMVYCGLEEAALIKW
jgi:hypothetical protein